MLATVPSQPTINLIEQGIATLKSGDQRQAAVFLALAVANEPANETAWLWLSAVVATAPERKFCLERILALNPEHAAAKHGLALLPVEMPAQPPSQPAQNGQARTGCTFPGCGEAVSRAGFHYCYAHWKAIYKPALPAEAAAPPAAPTPAPTPAPAAAEPVALDQLLSASALAERLRHQGRNINQVLAELGWISKAQHGWKLTEEGRALGGVQKFNTQTGIPFVLWPDNLIHDERLRRAVQSSGATSQAETDDRSFRERFPAHHRTNDGHLVRSKAEMLIDNWLYSAGIVHAYERQLPIEEEAYCDFYIPSGRVYIEYWGLEREPKYAARKQSKLELYQRYKLNLIELSDDHIKSLDDCLPRLLRRFGVAVG